MIKAEYIWVDGTKPTAQIRSKTKILAKGEEPPGWGFDGSSTNQAEGSASDCVLVPVRTYHDPIRGADNILVLCEVFNVDGTPHESNTRRELAPVAALHEDQDVWFGMEQEYTLVNLQANPVGTIASRSDNKFRSLPQGPYYCSAGYGLAIGRDLVETHLDFCLAAGIRVSGINAEVMPGQWEYQVGPSSALKVSDDLWISRYLLHRVSEWHHMVVTFEGKPAEGDWNGAGCHTNFSTREMRDSYVACEEAAIALGERHQLHIENYGAGIEHRLTGAHETCSYKEYRYGVFGRGTSMRIPWQVEREGEG